jgi:hypothetical protein
MTEYKPSVRTQIVMLATFFAVVLPAIWFSGMGYMWLIEHWQKLDSDATSEGVLDQLLNLVTVLPVLPVIVAAILISGIPWMFVVSRILSWADIQYYTKQKGRRIPFLSDWLDRLWLRMIESRRPKSPTSGSSE